MNKNQRQQRAQRRATPHLDVAFSRIVEHGIAPVDAAQAMMLFGAGALMQRLTGGEASASVLQVRDHLYAWMTEIAQQVGGKAEQHHQG